MHGAAADVICERPLITKKKNMSGDLREDKKDFTGWLLNQAFIEFIAGAQLQIHTILISK